VVSFTPRPLYSRGKNPRYPMDRRLSEHQSRAGRKKKICDPYRESNSDPSVVRPVASRCADSAIPATTYPAVKNQNIKQPTTLHIVQTSKLSVLIRTGKIYFIRISRCFSPDVKSSATLWKPSKADFALYIGNKQN
jgi:hypothetical protein